MFHISPTVLDATLLLNTLKNVSSGAIVVFEGWVRDHNQGKRVHSLEYQVYRELAVKEGEKILTEAREKFHLHAAHCSHREGHLALGESAVWIGATASHRDDAFKATRYIIDEIKHRLPIWKKEHYLDEKAQWVFCRDHLHHVHFHEEEFYQKQSQLIEQIKLKESKVMVIGAGGLGCPALTYLASSGIGRLSIVDFDTIEISNIHRQPLYAPHVVGEKKALIAQKKLQELNPWIQVDSFLLRVEPSNVEELIRGQDLILDCTDNMEAKFLLHDACFRQGIPLISASLYKYEGTLRSFVPGSSYGCLRCSTEKTPDDGLLGNCNDVGILGVSAGILGTLMASEAIEFLQKKKNASLSHTLYMDFKTLSQFKISHHALADCPTCQGLGELEKNPWEISLHELPELEFDFVDMRGQEDSYLEKFSDSVKKKVIYCHRGIRSKRLVKAYREKGFEHFYSLRGGALTLNESISDD